MMQDQLALHQTLASMAPQVSVPVATSPTAHPHYKPKVESGVLNPTPPHHAYAYQAECALNVTEGYALR